MAERVAFRMRVHPDKVAEYKKRHDEIWPEMIAALKGAGVSDYTIWHDPETNYLFATLVRSDDHSMDKLPETEANKKWWAFMRDVMDYDPNGRPTVVDLNKVFDMP